MPGVPKVTSSIPPRCEMLALTRVLCSRLHHVELRRQFRDHAGLQRGRHPCIRHVVGFRECRLCWPICSLLPLDDRSRSERRSVGVSLLMCSGAFTYLRRLWTTPELRSSLLTRWWSRLPHHIRRSLPQFRFLSLGLGVLKYTFAEPSCTILLPLRSGSLG